MYPALDLLRRSASLTITNAKPKSILFSTSDDPDAPGSLPAVFRDANSANQAHAATPADAWVQPDQSLQLPHLKHALEVWVFDHTEGTGDTGSVEHQYDEWGTCPAQGEPMEIDLTDGHAYEIIMVVGAIECGVNDPLVAGDSGLRSRASSQREIAVH